MITDYHGGHRREILLVKVRDLSVPALLARLRVERHEVGVRGLEEQPVAVHRHAAIAAERGRRRRSATRRSQAWSATPDPTPDPRATQAANRTESREAAWLFLSFQCDQIRGEVMDIGIAPFREHVDMPLPWIGDDDLRDRIVSGKALVGTVWLSERDDEGGDVIELSCNGLPRGQRHRYRRSERLGRCGAGRAATPPAATARHDQILNHLGLVPPADPSEVSLHRVTLRAVSS